MLRRCPLLNTSSNNSRRRQSPLEVVDRNDRNRQKDVLAFIAKQNASVQWIAALQSLQEAASQGFRVESDKLAPAIRNAPDWNIAKTLFFSAHQRLKVRPSPATVQAMASCAADHGKWQAALGFLVSDSFVSGAASSSSSNKQHRQQLLHSALRSMQRPGHWALALCITHAMRRPGTQHVFDRRVLFGNHDDHHEEATQQKTTNSTTTTIPPRQSQPPVDATPELLHHLVSVTAAAGRWTDAIRLVTSADRQLVQLNGETVEQAMRACYTAGKHTIIASLVNRMIATDTPIREDAARLCLRSLETVAASPASSVEQKQQSWMDSLCLFSALANQGLALNRQTYESPIRCCAASGQWVQAAQLVAEMRRDGLNAGHNTIELVASTKLAHGCANAHNAREFFKQMMSASILRPTTRNYNAAIAACVKDKDFKTLSKVLMEMKRAEVMRDKETEKWLIRAAYYKQRWELVLRNFLMLRKEILTEVEGARKYGYCEWPEEYELDDDVARMVLEACEMIGLSDPLSRNVTQAILAAKSDKKDDEQQEQQLLLGMGGAEQQQLSELSRRSGAMRRVLRRRELGDDRTRLPGSKKVDDADDAVVGSGFEIPGLPESVRKLYTSPASSS